jgi:hypothetical protein
MRRLLSVPLRRGLCTTTGGDLSLTSSVEHELIWGQAKLQWQKRGGPATRGGWGTERGRRRVTGGVIAMAEQCKFIMMHCRRLILTDGMHTSDGSYPVRRPGASSP